MDRPNRWSNGAVLRCAATSLLSLALIAVVGQFVARRTGSNSLGQVGDSASAREQSLHYGKNYFENVYGVSGDLNHYWWCGHYFRSLCRTDGRDSTPWYQKTDWLDYSSRLKVHLVLAILGESLLKSCVPCIHKQSI